MKPKYTEAVSSDMDFATIVGTGQRRAESLLRYAREHGVRAALRFSWWKIRSAAARNEVAWNLLYCRNPFVAVGRVEDYGCSADEVWNELRTLAGIECKEWQLDPVKFEAYVRRAGYERFDPYYQGGDSGDRGHRTEKLLQHYLSLELLQIEPNDVYIDVASNTSPMRHIAQHLFGAKSYSLDLSYEPGVHGELIGADAGAMPVESSFATKMTLHCSFEHFANGADSRFVKECARVLRSGGKVCIVPLYMLPTYCVRVDPTREMNIAVGDLEGAKKVYVRGYNVNYGRFYSPRQFAERVLASSSELQFTVYRIRGLEKLAPENVYSHLVLVIQKP